MHKYTIRVSLLEYSSEDLILIHVIDNDCIRQTSTILDRTSKTSFQSYGVHRQLSTFLKICCSRSIAQ